MIKDFVNKIIDGFNFNVKDFVVLLIIGIFLYGGYQMFEVVNNTNEKVNAMEERYFHDVEENGFAVLASLQNNNILEPKEIIAFLESKPAGKSDLRKALYDEMVYERLVKVFDGLAKNAKKALIY